MTEPRSKHPSVAEVARDYIGAHPSIREALRDDLVNYAALARKIQQEQGLASLEALTVACARYQRAGRGDPPGLLAVRAIVRKSHLEVHSHVALLRLDDDWSVLDAVLARGRRAVKESTESHLFEVFQGTRSVTVLCQEHLLPALLNLVPEAKRLGTERGLSVLAFRSRPGVAETPGVLAYSADELFRNGINALETVSVHADSILVFRDRDVLPAFATLSRLLATLDGPFDHGRQEPARFSRSMGRGPPTASEPRRRSRRPSSTGSEGSVDSIGRGARGLRGGGCPRIQVRLPRVGLRPGARGSGSARAPTARFAGRPGAAPIVRGH
ncbi:MAG: hypothetical protein L3K15_02120 [Thermoplasmata archaeon]|nr:hypothetical protein [Thermoplasmata archaeon]